MLGLGNVIHVPYYSLGPGPATDVIGLIEVRGEETFTTDGQLLLTTAAISNTELTVFEYLWTFADGDLEAVPKERFVPPGTTDAEQDAANIAAMDESKYAAELAAYTSLGFQLKRNGGARVLTVVPGTGAAAHLERGDRIVKIGKTVISAASDVQAALARYAPGGSTTLDYVRAGKTTRKRFNLGSVPGEPEKPRLGVQVADSFKMPATVKIDTQRIGGPSGGLVFALALYELLSEEDLTRGRVVAATGTIEFEQGIATIGPIGGIAEKVKGARAVGAEVFLVPEGNFQEAMAAAPDGLEVIAVATFQDAIEALRLPSF